MRPTVERLPSLAVLLLLSVTERAAASAKPVRVGGVFSVYWG